MFQWWLRQRSLCNFIFNNLCVSVMIEPGKCIYAVSFFTVCVSVLVLTEAEKMCMCKLIFSGLFQWWLRCRCLCVISFSTRCKHIQFSKECLFIMISDADTPSARFLGKPLLWIDWLIDDHLYSAIEQTHCAHLWFYVSDKLFIAL